MSKQPFLHHLPSGLSRREFLQLAGLGFAGLFLPGKFISNLSSPELMSKRGYLLGRVTHSGYQLYEAPDINSDVITEMDKDSLWRITSIAIGDHDISPNRIWYELEKKGYAHSRRIQPVKQIYNDPKLILPEGGCLGEITVPYVDACAKPEEDSAMVYRIYYASTFWILRSIMDARDKVWYRLLDDRTYRVFYVPGKYVRLVPDSELTALSPNVPPEEKKIVVDLQTQSLTAYEGERIAFMSRISSGVRLREGGYATPKGNYRITRKRPCRHMATPPSEFGSGFDLPGVPWVSYFTSDGVALHGSYWHNDFGVPYSHGCVNMTPEAAKWVYRWTTPTVPPDKYYYADTNGTRVIIH